MFNYSNTKGMLIRSFSVDPEVVVQYTVSLFRYFIKWADQEWKAVRVQHFVGAIDTLKENATLPPSSY